MKNQFSHSSHRSLFPCPLHILYIPHVECAVCKSNPDHQFPLHVHKADCHVLMSESCSHGLVPSVGNINFGQRSAKLYFCSCPATPELCTPIQRHHPSTYLCIMFYYYSRYPAQFYLSPPLPLPSSSHRLLALECLVTEIDQR